MSSEELLARVRRHNMLAIALAVLLVPVAILLWMFSWHLTYWITAFLLHSFGFAASRISFWVAWGFCGLLLFEGLTVGRKLFDLGEYTRSGFYDNFIMQSDSGAALNLYHGSPFGRAWLLTQILLCAPHVTLEAISRFRSIISVDAAIIQDAADLLTRLRTDRNWIRARDCGARGVSVALLRRLDLIWLDERGDGAYIRYPAGVK